MTPCFVSTNFGLEEENMIIGVDLIITDRKRGRKRAPGNGGQKWTLNRSENGSQKTKDTLAWGGV